MFTMLCKTAGCLISPTKELLSVHSTLVLLHSTSHHSFLFIPNLFLSDVLKYLYISTSTKALKLSDWHICRQIAQRKHTRIYFLKCLQVITLKAKFCSCEQKSRRSILPTGTVGISPFSLCQKVLRYQGRSCCHNAKLQAVWLHKLQILIPYVFLKQ